MTVQVKVTAVEAVDLRDYAPGQQGPRPVKDGAGWSALFAFTCENGETYVMAERADLRRQIAARIADPSSMLGEPSGSRTRFVVLNDDAQPIGFMIRFGLRAAS